jgi:8-oxo-dGTP pyrophosphatase MutT (NUDIX family)
MASGQEAFVDRQVTLRLAATMIIVRDDPFEVLLLERHAEAHFGSALVFPGGGVDPADSDDAWLPFLDGAAGLSGEQRALRIAACRETFEEAGLLVAVSGEVPPDVDDRRTDGFFGLFVSHRLRLDLSAMRPFAHWITPAGAPKRFDTHFFLVAAPSGAEGVCDGKETVRAEWVKPAEIGRWGIEKQRQMMLPTRANLHRLAESKNVASALKAARDRPLVTVQPVPALRDGRRIVSIPADAGYGDVDPENLSPTTVGN